MLLIQMLNIMLTVAYKSGKGKPDVAGRMLGVGNDRDQAAGCSGISHFVARPSREN
jgi:hypothetical protein